jgi:hypothetical protein
VYVKLVSVMVPVSASLVQFPFGQVACASKSAAVGTGEELSEGTVSLPFFGDSDPVVAVAPVTWDLTSTIWPPWLRHWTVAEYVATNDPVAFVLPTPASSYELHVTERPVTVQVGEPVWTCVPVGAAAALKVVTIAAEAATADSANTSIASAVKIPNFFTVLILSSVVGFTRTHRRRVTRMGDSFDEMPRRPNDAVNSVEHHLPLRLYTVVGERLGVTPHSTAHPWGGAFSSHRSTETLFTRPLPRIRRFRRGPPYTTCQALFALKP